MPLAAGLLFTGLAAALARWLPVLSALLIGAAVVTFAVPRPPQGQRAVVRGGPLPRRRQLRLPGAAGAVRARGPAAPTLKT